MRPDRTLLRALTAMLGVVCLALGVIGAFLPLMPSTVFFIGAAACVAHASPRLEAWLLSFDFIGRPVRDWRERGAIARPAKMLASAGMIAGFGLYALAGPGLLWLCLAGIVLAGCALFVWTRPG